MNNNAYAIKISKDLQSNITFNIHIIIKLKTKHCVAVNCVPN